MSLTRQPEKLASSIFDIAIIGGGITGACIARDASRRGLKVALLERGDFSAGTSASTSKMVHGGLRYLQSLQLGVVRESLRERRIWERIAPHMVRPQYFIVPSEDRKHDIELRLGLGLYDLLSFDRNLLDDPAQHIARSRHITGAQAVQTEPVLADRSPYGAMVYGDCVMYSPERLALECLIDAAEHSAIVANYSEVTAVSRDSAGRGVLVTHDLISGEVLEIRSRIVVNAAGPWADDIAGFGGESHLLLRSKGIHVVTRPITSEFALTIPHGGRHFFVIPWRNHSLIGTTDTPYSGQPADVSVSVSDVASFLSFVNEALPGAELKSSDVVYAYAGLRPLLAKAGVDSYKLSRRSEIIDHTVGDGVPMLSVIGGKWTTSRALAQRCVDLVARRSGISTRPCDTATARLPGAASGRTDSMAASIASRYPNVAIDGIESAVRNFGSRATRVLDLAANTPGLAEPVGEQRPNTLAEICFSARYEMALSLEDVLFRRTGIGTLGTPGRAAVERVALVMARELGWSDAETREQLLAVAARFRPSND